MHERKVFYLIMFSKASLKQKHELMIYKCSRYSPEVKNIIPSPNRKFLEK